MGLWGGIYIPQISSLATPLSQSTLDSLLVHTGSTVDYTWFTLQSHLICTCSLLGILAIFGQVYVTIQCVLSPDISPRVTAEHSRFIPELLASVSRAWQVLKPSKPLGKVIPKILNRSNFFDKFPDHSSVLQGCPSKTKCIPRVLGECCKCNQV